MTTETKDTLVFVCSGNSCRSPMAAKLVEHALKVEPAPLSDLKVVSCGTSALTGMPASRNSIFALSKVGIDLSDHSSQPVSQVILDRALSVYCMTSCHRDAILAVFDVDPSRVFLMRQWVGTTESDHEIPDPYGGDVSCYLECRDSMVEAVPALVAHLRELLAGGLAG